MTINEKLKQQAKRVVLELVRQSSGEELSGKTRLFKAFYFAHLFHARDNADYLTEWPIVRMPNGPGIDCFDDLLKELVAEELLSVRSGFTGPYQTEIFQATEDREKDLELRDTQVASIRRAVEFIEGKSAVQLSDLTHEHSRSWGESTEYGEELNVYRDLLSDEQIAAARTAESIFNAAWHE